jgi:DNA-binding NarL/FixJ family response regulator
MVAILLVETDDEYTTLLRSELRDGFEIHRVGTLRDALATMARRRWDCVLLNLRLPDSTDFMRTAVEVRRVIQCPIWALTSLNNLDFAKRAMRAGLTGYIVKGAQRGPEISRIIRDGISIHLRDSMSDVIQDQMLGEVPSSSMEIPLMSPPMAGTPPRMDIEGTMRQMHHTMTEMATTIDVILTPEQRARLVNKQEGGEGEEDFVEAMAKKVAKKWTLGKILMWAVGSIGGIFSAGMAYALMVGENATDTEVTEAIHQMVVEHNGGVDPNEKTKNGVPFGHHPDMKEDLKKVKADTEEIKEDVAEIGTSQKRSEKREKYQFLMSRYQTELIECQKKRGCKPSKKPPELDTLEAELLLGNYD